MIVFKNLEFNSTIKKLNNVPERHKKEVAENCSFVLEGNRVSVEDIPELKDTFRFMAKAEAAYNRLPQKLKEEMHDFFEEEVFSYKCVTLKYGKMLQLSSALLNEEI